MTDIKTKTLVQQANENLEVKVKNGSVTIDDFKNLLYDLRETSFNIQTLLEFKQEENPEYRILFNQIKNENYGEMVDSLNSLGYNYKSSKQKLEKEPNHANRKLLEKQKNLTIDFNHSGYRIMEQVRAGKKDDAFYSILRIFMSNGMPFPKKLLSPFKQYNNEMFKVLIFSFLSGIIEEKTKND